MVQRQATFSEKSQKMTLKGYYENLPESTHPKTDFVNKVAHLAGVSTATVRNWIAYGMKPNNTAHIDLLSSITGIAKEDLW